MHIGVFKLNVQWKIVDYLTSALFWFFFDIENRKKKLFNSLLDWQSLRYHDGIISVGSVNWKNIATIFSSYAKDNYGFHFHLFLLMGTISKNDRDELSKNKYYKSWLWSVIWENT